MIDIQRDGSIFEIELVVTDSHNRRHNLFAKLLDMPVVSIQEYLEAPEDELVARRFQEVEMADIQREARNLVRDGDWELVERMIIELEDRSRNNPWVQESVKYLRKLMEDKDRARLEKELVYASRSMKNRSADIVDNIQFSISAESIKPAFLRKKTSQGRNSDSQS